METDENIYVEHKGIRYLAKGMLADIFRGAARNPFGLSNGLLVKLGEVSESERRKWNEERLAYEISECVEESNEQKRKIGELEKTLRGMIQDYCDARDCYHVAEKCYEDDALECPVKKCRKVLEEGAE